MFKFLGNTRTWFSNVFKYPKVEYIPIAYNTLRYIPINSPVTRINVYESSNEIPNVSVSPYPSQRPGLYLALSNQKVVKVRFRGGVCTVVVDPNTHMMEVLWINAQYFPPGTIHFTVVSKDGRRLTWTNYRYNG